MSKPCKKCGGTERYKSGECAFCARERNRIWREKYPEKMSEARRRWDDENSDRKRETSRQWKANNPEAVRELKRRWDANNKEAHRAHSRKYRENNLEADRARARQWQRDNPEIKRAHNRARRARKAQAEGNFTPSEWKKLCKQYGNKCCYPGCERTDLHADHVVPLSRGGSNDISNIQPLCAYHNVSKDANANDYRYKPGFLRWIQRKLF
jgi:hypothetical protein